MAPDALAAHADHTRSWRETPGEIRAELAWGRRKARLLAWVRRVMAERLTERERACIELHYFRGLTYEAISRLTHTNRSSCCRAAQRGVRRLRAAAEEEGLRPVLPARLRGRGR